MVADNVLGNSKVSGYLCEQELLRSGAKASSQLCGDKRAQQVCLQGCDVVGNF